MSCVWRRELRNTCIAMGASMSAWGGPNDFPFPGIDDSFLGHICLETFQRVKFAGVYAIAGYTQAQVRSMILPIVLTLNPAPGACFYVDPPVNDIGYGVSFATMKTTLKSVVASLLGNGIVPILGTIPPQYSTDDSALRAVQQWNTWIRRYAAQNRFPLLDMWTAVAGADGYFLSGYDSGDHVHPNSAGHRAIAQQAIADGIADIFPENGSVFTSRWTGDLSNLFNNGTLNLGMFTTNSGGTGTGLTSVGSSTTTCSIDAPTASDKLLGNWQQLSRTTGNTGFIELVATLSGWSVGDVLAVSGRVQTSGITTTGTTWAVGVDIAIPGGYTFPSPSGDTVTNVLVGCRSFISDIDDGLFYTEVMIPTGTTAASVSMYLSTPTNAGTCTLRVGELTIVNLTTGSLLT